MGSCVIYEKWNENISKDRVLVAYIKAIWDWLLNMSSNFLLTQFNSFLNRVTNAKRNVFWALKLVSKTFDYGVFICRWSSLCGLLFSFQFFPNFLKICLIFLHVITCPFKTSSGLVTPITFKRLFCFLHCFPYSSLPLQMFCVFDTCMYSIIFLCITDHTIFHHIFHISFLTFYQKVSHKSL